MAAPPTPTDVLADLKGDNEITVSWTAAADAGAGVIPITKFKILPHDGTNDLVPIEVDDVTITSVDIPIIPAYQGQQITFRVNAVSANAGIEVDNISAPSAAVRPAVPAVRPAGPAGPAVGGYSGEATFVLDVKMAADNKSIEKVNNIKRITTGTGNLTPKAGATSITGKELADALNGGMLGGARQRQSRKSKKAGGKKRRKSQRRKHSKQSKQYNPSNK